MSKQMAVKLLLLWFAKKFTFNYVQENAFTYVVKA